MKKSVYLDYAATTPLHPNVLAAMLPYLKEEFGNASSIHSWGQKARKAIDESREKVAATLSCRPEEIIFTGTTTTTCNLAIMGLVSAVQRKMASNKPLHMITSSIEHHAVLDTFSYLQKEKHCDVTFLPVDEYGLINFDDITSTIRPETVLISVMFANNEIGTVEPIEEIGTLIQTINEQRRQKGLERIYFHSDCATAAEYFPLNVGNLGLDLLSLGAHKFHGPKGMGILYIKKGTPVAAITHGGHHERSLWPGTENVAGIVGTAVALDIAQKDVCAASEQAATLRDRLIEGILKSIAKAQLMGHFKKRLPDIATFTFEGAEGESILLMLNEIGIAASSGSACTSGDLKPSHVLLACGVKAEIAHSSIRFSLGKETTEADIDYVLKELPPIIEKLRSMSPYGMNVHDKEETYR